MTRHDDSIQAVYHADPLCGWCFAIADELADARHQLGDDVEWTLRMGGLVVGDRVRAVAHDAEYLRSGLAQVHAASGRSAGDPYWTEIVDVGTWVSDSEPVCRAVLTAIELADTDAGFAASHRLSDLLYVEGVEPDSLDALHEVARTIGLDGDGFVEHWASPHTRDRLTAHWADTRRSGLQTYPTIAVLSDGRLQPVVTGFAPAAAIVERIRAAGDGG